jgi:hypothetical protein
MRAVANEDGHGAVLNLRADVAGTQASGASITTAIGDTRRGRVG